MPSKNKDQEYARVWSLSDYGAIDALAAARGGSSAAPAGAAAGGGRTLFPEGMATGVSTVIEQGKIKPTPAVRSAAQEVIKDPQAFVDQRIAPDAKAQEESLLDKGKSLLAQVFDVTDTWKDGKYQGADNPVESVWDTFLTGVNWFYDRISQVTVAGISGLPGGTRTLTWDEANDVSVGQIALTNAALADQAARRGDLVGAITAQMGTGVLGMIGTAISPDLSKRLASDQFDLASAEDRKIFDEDPVAKWTSGLTDTVFSVAADPFIVGGKFLKVTRLKYVDRPVTQRNMAQMVKELTDGLQYAKSGEIDKMAPIARLAYDAVTPGADGMRQPVRQLTLRDEINFSHDAEGVADALATLRDNDIESAILVMGVGLGDVGSLRALADRSVIAADTLINAKRKQLEAQLLLDPTAYAEKSAAYKTVFDARLKTLTDLKQKRAEGGVVSLDEINQAQKNLDEAMNDIEAIENGRVGAAIDKPTQGDMAYYAAMVDEAKANFDWFRRALDESKFGAFVGADRGFATNTAVGRFVANRRARRARAEYERKSVSGQGVTSTDYFGNGIFRRGIRVWRTFNDETPSYYLNFASNVDQGREVGAFLDSLEYLSGAPLKIVDKTTGKTVEIGGVQRKDQLFQMYTSAKATGEQVFAAMTKIQNEIRDDISAWYGIDKEIMEQIQVKGINEYDRLRSQITSSKDGFFLSDEASNVPSLNLAPFLETQLANGDYFLPWDVVEKIAKNVKSGKIVDPSAKAVFTPGQEFGRKLLAANDLFQDFWRPAVLFRLGYPQRNVAEGLFRSIAFSGSLEPLLWAGKAGVASVKNYRRIQRAAKKAAKAKRQIEAPDEARDKFDGLVAKQKELHLLEGELTGAKIRIEQQQAKRAEALSLPTRMEVSFADPAGDGRQFVNSDGSIMVRVEDVTVGEATEPRFVVFQQDTVDPTKYFRSPGAFKSIDDAQVAIQKAMVDAFEGTRVPQGPQFALIAEKGQQARNMKVEPFVASDGNVYSAIDEIDAAKARISQELGAINLGLKEYGGRPMPEAFKKTEFVKWRSAQIQELDSQIQSSIAYEDFVKSWMNDAGLTEAEIINADKNLMVLRQIREQDEAKLAWLEEDDYYALEAFQNQAQARQVAHNGSKSKPVNGIVLAGAFGDPRYRDIHWMNMSSDNTIRATLSARMALNDSIIYRMKIDDYVDVLPSQGDAYWEGMASMLRQYSQSLLGRKILGRDSDESIGAWLIGDPKGQRIRDDLDFAWEVAGQGKNGIPRIGNDLQSAMAFVSQVRAGLEQITAGNTAVWKVMLDHPPTPAELKALMGDMKNLSPVVGSKSEVEGFAKYLDVYRKLTQKAFQKIGTQVEDAFVRGPFYAERYVQVRDEMLANLRAQFATEQQIPLELALTVERNAHRRALKDTKDFLYTIDRRTKLGKYGEVVFPFISATQNSLTSVGRLIRRDPSIPGIMLALWQAPTKVGWEDKDGNIIVPLPADLLPDGVEDFFGLRGMKNIKINKSSLNVIFPESGFAFVPRPAPLIQAGASELMKNGLFGQFGVEAPPMLTNILGPKEADLVWKHFKDYLYGEEGGISAEMASYDKLLPPVMTKMLQYLRKDGSAQYAYQYAIQARTQDLLFRAGERDDYPTSQEIMDRTNGMFMLRMLGNMLAFTPPNYESSIQPLIDMQRLYDEVYGIEGPMKFSENFGNEMLILANTETTTNPAGATSTPSTVRNIKKYEGLIRDVVPSIGQDYEVIGMLVNDNIQDSFYDPNAYRWMQVSKIPGTNQLWRDTNSGPESMAESQRQAGWVEYIKFKGQLDALLQQRGLTSYRVKGAEDLNLMRKEFINNMRDNPMYEGWRVDWDSQGSSKTQSAIQTMRAALQDENFMSDHGGSKTWQIAALYLEKRDLLMRLVKESGATLENDINQQLKDEWDSFRQDLINKDVAWANIANRYLTGDDNPVEPGASFGLGG